MGSQFRFLISGTDTGVGKTTVGCGLASAFKARGLMVGVMKPVETGCELRDGELTALDAMALRDAAQLNTPIELICPYRYAAPLAPAAAAELEDRAAPELGEIGRIYERLAADSEVMLVEGAGGISVPITWHENYVDLALALKLELILVVANRLGCLNSTILSLEYAARRGLAIKGYILNDTEATATPATRTNARSLERLTSIRCLGEIRHRAPMPAEICQEVLGSKNG